MPSPWLLNPLRNPFLIIHLLGAVQGVFLAAVLMSKQRHSVSNTLLGLTMLTFALDLAAAVYQASGFHETFPHLIGVDYPLTFLYGPLLYLYVVTISDGAQRFNKAYVLHFVPFVLVALFLIPFYVQGGDAKLAFLRSASPDLWTQILGWVNHFKLIHALIYIGSIFVALKRHRRRVKDSFSTTERISLNWLRNLLVAILVLAGTAILFYLLTLNAQAPLIGHDPASPYDDYTLLGVAIFVYAIGFMGLRQPEIFDHRWAEDPASLYATGDGAPTDTDPPKEPPEAPQPEKPLYAKSGMDADTAHRYKEALLTLMETEKLYRQSDLTLQDLSDALSISPHNLTEVINTQLQQNFYDFVNGYRVREVQERLTDPRSAHLTLLAIGLEAGFNSKSTFNAVFKKHTHLTPSQYRRVHTESSVA